MMDSGGLRCLLLVLTVATSLRHVSAQTYNVVPNRDVSGCVGGESMGLVTSTSTVLADQANLAARSNAGTGFNFADSIAVTPALTNVELGQCLTICQTLRECSAIEFTAQTNCGTTTTERGTCVYTEQTGSPLSTTTLQVTSRGTSARASCSGGVSGTSVYVKYCTTRTSSVTLAGSSNNNNNNNNQAGGAWSAWSPWEPCFTLNPTASGETRTRKRFCRTAEGCTCPTANACTTQTNDFTRQDETQPCTTAASTTCDTASVDQAYVDYCTSQKRITILGDTCSSCGFAVCIFPAAGQTAWRFHQFPCPPRMKYGGSESVCVDAEPGDICYSAYPTRAPIVCASQVDSDDIMMYRQNGVARMCPSGFVWGRAEFCTCVPGPTLHVRLRDVLFLLPCNAAQENAESNAAGHMGYTANPFPAASLIQFEAPTSNTVCVFRGGDSAGSADGLVVPSLNGIGQVLNPAFSLWFNDAPSSTGGTEARQTLVTNSDFDSFDVEVPNVELVLLNNRELQFVTDLLTRVFPNGVARFTQNVQIQPNTWYCVAVVFDNEATELYAVEGLTVRVYLKQAGGSIVTLLDQELPPSTDNNDFIMNIKRRNWRIAHNSEAADGTNSDYFTGTFDNFVFTTNTVLTEAQVGEICAVAPNDAAVYT